MILIREAMPSDAAGLALLAAETFPLACPAGTAPEQIQGFIEANFLPSHFASALADPNRMILVAEQVSEEHSVRREEPAAPDAVTELLGYTLSILEHPEDSGIADSLESAGLDLQHGVVELSKCYVRQSSHGGGVARQLMASTLMRSASAGVRALWLGVNQQNERAQKFYAKHGFTQVGTKQFLVGAELHDDYVLARSLSVPAPAAESEHPPAAESEPEDTQGSASAMSPA